MNPVFLILLFLGAGFLWLILAFAYPTVGKFFSKLLEDAKDQINKEERED